MVEVSASSGLPAGRHGAMDGAPGVIVQERRGAGFALITARSGRRDDLAQAVQSAFGLDLPPVGKRITGERLALTGTGRDRWLAERLLPSPEGIERHLADALGQTAAIVDQSDATIVLRVRGPRVRDVLATGLPVDLHPRAFAVGDAAQTLCAHIGVLVWRLADGDGDGADGGAVFELATPRSTIGSFRHWFETSALRHGLEVWPAAT